jgi:hypothetical protein
VARASSGRSGGNAESTLKLRCGSAATLTFAFALLTVGLLRSVSDARDSEQVVGAAAPPTRSRSLSQLLRALSTPPPCCPFPADSSSHAPPAAAAFARRPACERMLPPPRHTP